MTEGDWVFFTEEMKYLKTFEFFFGEYAIFVAFLNCNKAGTLSL